MIPFRESLLICRGRVIDPLSSRDETADVLILDGYVKAVAPGLSAPADCPRLDVDGCVVAPGFIDAHVHLREPGFEHKETIATGTAAAAVGGICTCIAMPNTQPPPDTEQHLEDIVHRFQAAGAVRVHPVACITRERTGQTLAPLDRLARMGAVAFSDDGDPVEDSGLMRAALLQARAIGRPIAPHEELKELSAGGCMNEGAVARRLGLRGMPRAAEEEMIARDIRLVRQTGGPLHVTHVSTARGVSLIQEARSAGLPVTCEVTVHHLILCEDAVERHGANAKMNPPLRTPADVEALRRALVEGTIDAIVTDHAPHTEQEKSAGISDAPFGIVGLETAVGLTLTHLVHPGLLDLRSAIACWTNRPAAIFGVPGGSLTPGAPGDVTVLDLDADWVVDPSTFRSRGRNTPFAGMRLKGRAVATIVGGSIVYSE